MVDRVKVLRALGVLPGPVIAAPRPEDLLPRPGVQPVGPPPPLPPAQVGVQTLAQGWTEKSLELDQSNPTLEQKLEMLRDALETVRGWEAQIDENLRGLRTGGLTQEAFDTTDRELKSLMAVDVGRLLSIIEHVQKQLVGLLVEAFSN